MADINPESLKFIRDLIPEKHITEKAEAALLDFLKFSEQHPRFKDMPGGWTHIEQVAFVVGYIYGSADKLMSN